MIYAVLDKNQNVLQFSFQQLPMAIAISDDEFVKKVGFLPVDPNAKTFEQMRDQCICDLSAACNAAIISGLDVELFDGTVEHFSLQETDQINLNAAYAACQQGAAEYPYHADGHLCRMYSATDIITIGDAATAHKLWHTTYCNHMMMWARRAETADELEGIVYGAELPADLAENMASILEKTK